MAYYLVLLSTQNLNPCRRYGLAGFPEGRDSLWPYFDIEVGDHLSFYRSGIVFDYYQVVSKQIARDPERDNPEWVPIGTPKRYYPYRLLLQPIIQSNNYYSFFRSELRPFGKSLLPRFAFGKSHIQLPTKIGHSILQAFRTGVPSEVYLQGNKWAHIETREEPLFNHESLTEKLIQVLIKRNIAPHLRLDEVEVLSETHLDFGQIDLFALGTDDDTIKYALIEVKKGRIGTRAARHISEYPRSEDEHERMIIGASYVKTVIPFLKKKNVRIFEYDIMNDEPTPFHDISVFLNELV
jgi:hypothetical protein